MKIYTKHPKGIFGKSSKEPVINNKSTLTGSISGKSGEEPEQKELSFNFKDFDHTQGQTFLQWEKASLLSVMLDKLKEYSRKTVMEAKKASFTIYGPFPPDSSFTHPKHITEDAVWVSLHIQGKECIAGHLIGNIFHVVFLDREHQFWPSKLKHT
jgi:hypothetical protein